MEKHLRKNNKNYDGKNYDGKCTCAKKTNEKLMKKVQNDDGMAIY